MWVLECDGDILNNKRVWLRPGKTYLFGRTKPETSQYQTGFRINHKTVSRKHLTIAVAPSGPEDVSLVNKRTELTFEDSGTKSGTKIDGEKISAGKKAVYSGLKHTFTLSSYEYAFRVVWKPVVMSFTFSSKDTKGGRDPLQAIRARLTGLDVKAIGSYAATKTTHVIASKRNTARGLQALIQGARIVNESFVNAIVAAATPADLDVPESFAPLEEDFDGSWPEDSAFLPSPGREPGPKDPELFEPDFERNEVFKGMTFVFCDLRQFENLQPPITDGGGKALHFNVVPQKTTTSELQRFIKDIAGEKDSGELDDESKVVAVKFGTSKEDEDWAAKLQVDLARALGFRLMEQNEFLGAILEKDVSKIYKRLEIEPAADHAAPASMSEHTIDSSGRVSEAHDSQPEAKPTVVRRRGKIASVFKGFDDGFDPNDIRQDPSRGHSSQESDNLKGRQARKRSPPDSGDDGQDIEDRLFPAAAIMKRRKLEEGAENGDQVRQRHHSSQSRSTTVPPSETETETKVKKEVDISAAVRARREAWDARAAAEEEDGMAGLEDMTVSQMKGLAVIEAMEIAARGALSESNGKRENGRWKDDWNGRKNFKRFRRRGEGDGAAQRGQGQAVIVPLEEVKRRDAAIGQGYWENARSNASSRYRQRIRATWEDEAEGSDDDESPLQPYASRTQHSRTSRISDNIDPASGPRPPDEVHVVVEGDNPEAAALNSDALRTSRSNGNATQTSASQQSKVVVGAKRPATQSSSDKTAATGPKRQRRLGESARRSQRDESDEDDDDLKFTFRRRG